MDPIRIDWFSAWNWNCEKSRSEIHNTF